MISEIRGTVILHGGEVVEFSLRPDVGWQKWGNTDEVLFQAGPVVEALNEAAAEYLEEEPETDDD